jgi:hypothetical protein
LGERPHSRAHEGDGAAKDLPDAVRAERTTLAEPQPGQLGVAVARTNAQVAVEGDGGLAAEGQGALAAALAEHQDHVQVQIEVGQAQADQLGPAGAGVEQEHHDGGIAATLEVLARAGGQQPTQAVLGDDRDGLLGHDGRAHLRHWTGGDLFFSSSQAYRMRRTL